MAPPVLHGSFSFHPNGIIFSLTLKLRQNKAFFVDRKSINKCHPVKNSTLSKLLPPPPPPTLPFNLFGQNIVRKVASTSFMGLSYFGRELDLGGGGG